MHNTTKCAPFIVEVEDAVGRILEGGEEPLNVGWLDVAFMVMETDGAEEKVINFHLLL